jgi:hypothetical protein
MKEEYTNENNDVNTLNENGENMESGSVGALYVNGKKITDENVTIHYMPDYSSYVKMPFTEVIKALGFDVEWISDSISHIIFMDKKYVLNLEDVSLVEFGYNDNSIRPAPGGTLHFSVMEKELILDGVTVMYVIQKMGVDISVRFDLDEAIVYITKR